MADLLRNGTLTLMNSHQHSFVVPFLPTCKHWLND